MSDDDLVQRLAAATSTLLRIFKVADSHNIAELPPPELHALLFVGEADGATPGEVAAHLAVAATTCTSIVDRLARQGLVTRSRDEVDRRSVRIRLTEAGRQAFDSVEAEHMRRYRAMLAPLTAEERRAIVGLMEKVAAAVTPRDTPPP
jgi:DNA-binding MarR family transcriptional regulator